MDGVESLFEETEEVVEEVVEEQSAPETETIEEEEVVEGGEETDEKAGEEDGQGESQSEGEGQSQGEEDELLGLKAQNQALLERLEALAEAKIAPKESVAETTVTTSGKKKFLKDDEELIEILDDREKFEEVLSRVHEDALVKAREEILSSIPKTVIAQVQQQVYLKKTVDDFMDEHSNLKPVRKTVGLIANEVSAEHADWTLPQVLQETAVRAYKVLGIKQKIVENKGGGNSSPAFATGGDKGSRKVSGSNKSSLQRELDELIELQ